MIDFTLLFYKLKGKKKAFHLLTFKHHCCTVVSVVQVVLVMLV